MEEKQNGMSKGELEIAVHFVRKYGIFELTNFSPGFFVKKMMHRPREKATQNAVEDAMLRDSFCETIINEETAACEFLQIFPINISEIVEKIEEKFTTTNFYEHAILETFGENCTLDEFIEEVACAAEINGFLI